MNISSKLNEIIFSVWNNEKIESEIFNSTIESLKIYEKLAIIKEIQLKNNKLFYFWGPAGNQSNRAKLIISGFSTSIQAAKDIYKNVRKEINNKTLSSEKLRLICAKAVYKGDMLKRLAWGLKQIIPIIDKLLDITLYDDLKEEWNNFKEIADTNNKLNEGKGKLFNGKVNCKIILTQSTLNGLGVENNNSITCNANSIPNKYALEYSKSFIPKLIEWNKKTLKLVIILGKDASICWGNSINIKKNIFIKNWWGNKDIPIDKNEVLFIHIPHPSGANPTYKKNIKKIVDVLEDRISK